MLVSLEDIVGCKIAGVRLDNSHLSIDQLDKINSFRKCLSAVWRLSTLTNTSKLTAAKSAFEALFEAC